MIQSLSSTLSNDTCSYPSPTATAEQQQQEHQQKLLEQHNSNTEQGNKLGDWVFINYTFKRFEGLTQRGPIRPSNFEQHS